MNVFRLAIGLMALTVASSSLNIEAHNSDKYTNIPFVVAAACTGGSATVNYVNQNGALGVRVTNGYVEASDSFGGWEVYTSFPGVGSGNSSPSATTTAPAGTYSFNISGLQGSGNQLGCDTTDSGNNHNFVMISITNGPVSVTAPPPHVGNSISAISFWAMNTTTGVVAPYFVTNFKVNNAALLIDTTHTDINSDATSFTWCNQVGFCE